MTVSKTRESLGFELDYWKSNPLIAGVDEAGRGALAGPIVIAAVVLPAYAQSALIQDSKILSPLQRKKAYQWIQQNSLEYKIAMQNVRQVEIKNPLQATKEAMVKAVSSLNKKPDLCLVDGKEKIEVPGVLTKNIIGGDRKSISIAAASIIAKVTRDEIMINLHKEYPQYSWMDNKGYPNNKHLKAIFEHGICSLHRRTYEPIKSWISGRVDFETICKKYNLTLIR